MILSDFFKALGQLGDPRFRRVLLLGIGLTIALLMAASVVIVWLVGLVLPEVVTLPLIGEVTWVDNVASWAMVAITLVLSIVLMVPVAMAFTGIWLDDVAAAVEARFYPHLPEVDDLPILETLRDATGLILATVGINLIALLLLFFVGPFAPVLFWAVNGYLLGREYFQLAAMRRVGRAEANRLRSRHGFQIWLGGVLMAIPLSVPIVNLFIPVVGAATFTHMYHRLAGAGRRAV